VIRVIFVVGCLGIKLVYKCACSAMETIDWGNVCWNE